MITLAAVGTVVGVGLRRGGAPTVVRGDFGQHWRGLEERRLAAGVATMGNQSADVHDHLSLRVWVNGRRVRVPSGIGIDPARPTDHMGALHTHSDDGKVHNEGQANANLAQLLQVWGVAFAPDRLGPHHVSGTRKVQMWVDGRPSRAWGALRLRDGQEVDLAYGRPLAKPPGG